MHIYFTLLKFNYTDDQSKELNIYTISIITQVIIEILALWLAENGVIITSAEVIIAGGQIFKIAASRFVNVSKEEIKVAPYSF